MFPPVAMLRNKLHRAAGILDLLLGQLANELGLHHDGLLGQLALAQDLRADKVSSWRGGAQRGVCDPP